MNTFNQFFLYLEMFYTFIDIQEDKQELIDFNLFQNPTIYNNIPLVLPLQEQQNV